VFWHCSSQTAAHAKHPLLQLAFVGMLIERQPVSTLKTGTMLHSPSVVARQVLHSCVEDVYLNTQHKDWYSYVEISMRKIIGAQHGIVVPAHVRTTGLQC